MTVLCGIAGWIDQSLIKLGGFYPPGVTSSEARLQFYARQFPLVEVDSTYYGMPKRETVQLWADRTPAGFRFDVKAFSLLTHHPTKPAAIFKEIREALPAGLRERNLYLDQAPPDVVDQVWESFKDALEPLRAAGKLGAVLFQFPPWFFPTSRNLAYIEQCQERMDGFEIAVEFRKREWLDGTHAARTFDFLRSRRIPYVAVDVPQGFETSMPPLAEATSDRIAIIRFHGRNLETWAIKGAPPNLRFRHLYTEAELNEWVPRIRALAAAAREVHAVMNNNYSNYSVQNARMLAEMLEGA